MIFWTFSILEKSTSPHRVIKTANFLPHGGNTEPQDSYKGCNIPKNCNNQVALDIILHLNDILDIFHFRKKFQHPMIECTGDFSIDLASPNSTHATPKFFDNDKMPFIARTDKCYMYLTLFVQNLLCWSRKKS